MVKPHAFDAAIAPLRALDWHALPPAEQRALFSQLTAILLAMMEQDRLPDDQLRRTNADRDRRTAENEDKLALLHTAIETLFLEMLDEDQYRALLQLCKINAYTLEDALPAWTSPIAHG